MPLWGSLMFGCGFPPVQEDQTGGAEDRQHRGAWRWISFPWKSISRLFLFPLPVTLLSLLYFRGWQYSRAHEVHMYYSRQHGHHRRGAADAGIQRVVLSQWMRLYTFRPTTTSPTKPIRGFTGSLFTSTAAKGAATTPPRATPRMVGQKLSML